MTPRDITAARAEIARLDRLYWQQLADGHPEAAADTDHRLWRLEVSLLPFWRRGGFVLALLLSHGLALWLLLSRWQGGAAGGCP